MKKICVITTCRADFGYLYWIMKDIEASDKLQLQIIHPENHHNIQQIYDEFIKNGTAQHLDTDAIHSIDDFGQFYSDCLENLRVLKPNLCLICGDRFEAMAATTAALLPNIKICHIHGGENTTGAFDNEIRNAITQMSTYHFTAHYEHSKQVGRMVNQRNFDIEKGTRTYNGNIEGNTSNFIYTVGSPGLDYLTRSKLLSKQELQQRVTINLNLPYFVCCFHPETKDLANTERHIKSLCTALDQIGEQILFVAPNIDPNNNIIRQVVQSYDLAGQYSDCKPHLWHCVDNLDHITYLSLLQYTEMMIGNSSSGIIESPSFHLPSISVGSRQDGRIKASNTFSCSCETDAILDAVGRARIWNATVGKCENPYGRGDSSRKIVEILEAI